MLRLRIGVRLPQVFPRKTNMTVIFWKPIFDNLIFNQNHRFHENKKDSRRNNDQFPGGLASVSLLCVRIERIWLLSNNLIFDDGGDGDDGDGRISGRAQAPIPSHPGIKYPVRAPPLTPMKYNGSVQTFTMHTESKNR